MILNWDISNIYFTIDLCCCLLVVLLTSHWLSEWLRFMTYQFHIPAFQLTTWWYANPIMIMCLARNAFLPDISRCHGKRERSSLSTTLPYCRNGAGEGVSNKQKCIVDFSVSSHVLEAKKVVKNLTNVQIIGSVAKRCMQRKFGLDLIRVRRVEPKEPTFKIYSGPAPFQIFSELKPKLFRVILYARSSLTTVYHGVLPDVGCPHTSVRWRHSRRP